MNSFEEMDQVELLTARLKIQNQLAKRYKYFFEGQKVKVVGGNADFIGLEGIVYEAKRGGITVSFPPTYQVKDFRHIHLEFIDEPQ